MPYRTTQQKTEKYKTPFLPGREDLGRGEKWWALDLLRKGDGMEGDELKAGKERVRVHLIEPLVREGMRRKRGVTVDDHRAFLDRLAALLSYMRADALDMLARRVRMMGGGKKKDIWPSEISIKNWARSLQEPPPSDSRFIRSYMQSAAGQAALAGGYAVELYGYMKRQGVKPTAFALAQLRDRARENACQVQMIRGLAEKGRASNDQLRWVEGYEAATARAMAVVNAGREAA